MNYTGVIIEESLKTKDVLNLVKIISTKISKVTERNATPWLKQWTLHSVEIPEADVQAVVKSLSESLSEKHWFADFKNNLYHYIVFSGKVFQVELSNPVLYAQAKEYGLSLGIPEHQLDFI